jgi:hypothetical protein
MKLNKKNMVNNLFIPLMDKLNIVL